MQPVETLNLNLKDQSFDEYLFEEKEYQETIKEYQKIVKAQQSEYKKVLEEINL